MENSHVVLISVNPDAARFTTHRWDCPMLLGANLVSLTKMLKLTKDDGIVILQAEDGADVLIECVRRALMGFGL